MKKGGNKLSLKLNSNNSRESRRNGSNVVEIIVREEVETFIISGKYVEFDKIRRKCEERMQQELSASECLQQQKQLTLDPTLRLIQEFNLEVNSVVDAYYYTTPVRIFHDCEKFVFEQMKNWLVRYKQIGSYETAKSFADFYFGEFLQVPRVIKFFKCSLSNPPLHYISHEEVIETFMDIVMGNTSKPGSQSIGGLMKGKIHETEVIDFPANFHIGKFIGPGGSNIKSLRDLTWCKIQLNDTEKEIILQGPRECINDAKQRILGGKSSVDYQEKFETILNIKLQERWLRNSGNETNYPGDGNTGVIVDAKSLHKHLSTHWSKLLKVYDLKSTEFVEILSKRVKKNWHKWLKVRSFCVLCMYAPGGIH